ncbi:MULTISPECIES: ATP-binding protein [unclassified Streptomyces]|uniref:ATP-binding protein n=1 Tax=unclassified Streptomyces TaxID=2593676 RepID=UPI002B1CCA08|nr:MULTISPECIES: ATP-binding protein [unclassified Streptomyces]
MLRAGCIPNGVGCAGFPLSRPARQRPFGGPVRGGWAVPSRPRSPGSAWTVRCPARFPFEPEAANLFFQFISGRYERASVIVTSNKPFGRWGEDFGDDTVAAMIDRLVHHAEVISLKGDSYRMRGRDLGRVPAANTGE